MKKVILLILDGWGIAKPDKFNAIHNAKTPIFDMLMKEYPNMLLKAHGEYVGLPPGQMGTSEVNHLAIGTGRIVYQDLVKINRSLSDGSFYSNSELLNAINHAKKNNSSLHIAGILSDGGVHDHIEHFFALMDLVKKENFAGEVYFHIFTDGRDTPPRSAVRYLEQLETKMNATGIGEIATIQGRVYLDRDRDWAKTEKAFALVAKGEGIEAKNWQEVIDECYKKYDNDQYFDQFVIKKEGILKAGDTLIFTHFRTDRLFQIAKRILDEKIPNFYFTAFCKPAEDFNFTAAFDGDKIENSLAKVISEAGRTQAHITETEKYPHLTYFFNGERENELPEERWKLFESNRFVKPEYNFEPSMQAFKITDEILAIIDEGKTDFTVVNFANTDMVGHTGNYEAAVIAAESVDFCIGKIYEKVKNKLDEYVLMVTADHGNSDEMWDYTNDQPHTQHTLNPVPFIVITKEKIKLGGEDSLQNIAPTILEFMGIEKPSDMSGKSLVLR